MGKVNLVEKNNNIKWYKVSLVEENNTSIESYFISFLKNSQTIKTAIYGR